MSKTCKSARIEYLQVLRAMPGRYPGSATLATHLLAKNASYMFCDTDPESARSLREAGADLEVRVVEQDGVSTIAREAESATGDPSRVLVHIDPFDPHERIVPDRLTPIELAASLAQRGFRVFYWYGYDDAVERFWAYKEISRLAPGVNFWCGDVRMPAPFVYPDRSGAWGCGVVLANVTPEEEAACARLGHALERISADDVLDANVPPRLTFEHATNRKSHPTAG